jgi:hypothetical protein
MALDDFTPIRMGERTVTRKLIGDATVFSAVGGQLNLRGYQVDVARAIVYVVVNRWGGSFVVIFPRQSGKKE